MDYKVYNLVAYLNRTLFCKILYSFAEAINFFLFQRQQFSAKIFIRMCLQMQNNYNTQYTIQITSMPRTEHLSAISPNHIYALNAQVLYTHHTPNMTTAIIEDDHVQSKIKIPQSLNNIRQEIEEGMNYHFGYCYIAPNGWIKARNPDSTIRPAEQMGNPVLQPMLLSDIANNYEALNGHYLSTLLFVTKVHQSQQIVKNGKNLSMVILNCYANGYIVDVTLWNSDLPIADLTNKWIVFSGFRLKKLAEWKFVFVSSVYSKIAPYEGEPKSLPFSPLSNYHNLSSVFDPRSISQIIKIAQTNPKFFSQTEAQLKKVQCFNYQGCSVCRKKINQGIPCACTANTDIKLYTIMKLTLVGADSKTLQASVFEQQVQKQISKLTEPTVLKFNIKSTSRAVGPEEVAQSHVVTKISL